MSDTIDEWDKLLKTTQKLERKHKVIICRKRLKSVYIPEDEKKKYSEPDYKKVDEFSKNEKRTFEAQATLDLHGYTEEAAFAAILNFLDDSYQRGFRNLIIITGGSANNSKTLREMYISRVSADFSPLIAKVTCPSDNTGAFWVKLRKRR